MGGNATITLIPRHYFCFLFTLTKIASGDDNKKLCNSIFSGLEQRYSYGYPWMLRYLDRIYEGIIGHGGLW